MSGDIIEDAFVEIALLREWLNVAEDQGDTPVLHGQDDPESPICRYCDKPLPCYMLRTVSAIAEWDATDGPTASLMDPSLYGRTS